MAAHWSGAQTRIAALVSPRLLLPDPMLVSVVIPLYNSANFVGEAIRSVLGQTHRELELIVIDDGSTDDSVERAREAIDGDPRARVLCFPNGGAAVARNRGLAEARGEFIAPLDADDRWMPDKLEKQLAALLSEPDCVCIGCLMGYIAADGKPLPRLVSRLVQTGEDPRQPGQQELIRRALVVPFPPSAMLMRTAAVRAVGGSDETLGCLPGEEQDLLARLAWHGRVSMVPERLAEYRLRDDSHSGADHLYSRRVARFISLRQRARLAGAELSWEQFDAEYRPSFKERRGAVAAVHYRLTGVNFLNRSYARAAFHAVIAALVRPAYVVARAQRNLFSQSTPADAYRRSLAPDGRPWLTDEVTTPPPPTTVQEPS